jgi:hypothetical protein
MSALLKAFAFISRIAAGKVRAQSASVDGRGAVYHRDGRVTEFRLEGEPSAAILAFAHRKVFGKLASLYPRQLGAVTHGTAIAKVVCDAVVDALDPGGPGNLIFRTSGDAEVATLPFSATAFGAGTTAAPSVATAAAITSDTSATGGTVAKFTAETAATVIVFTGAVSTSGSDINLSSLAVGASDTVAVSSLTYSSMP